MKQRIKPYIPYIIFSVIYIILSLVLSPNQTTIRTYGLNEKQYRLLDLTVILPLIAIWFIAFFGYIRLKEYTAKLQGAKEQKHFGQLARGLQWFAWGLPITSILQTILQHIAFHNSAFHKPSVIIHNYISLIVAVGAFTFISNGTAKLNELAKNRPRILSSRILTLVFIVLGVGFCYIIFSSLNQHYGAARDPYLLPKWAVMFTFVVPYLYAWLLGMWSALEIALYSQHAKGIFYKSALRSLAIGIGVVILSSVFIQYLTSITPQLHHLDLNLLLLVVYILLVIYALGYGLIALGARRLKKLEEV